MDPKDDLNATDIHSPDRKPPPHQDFSPVPLFSPSSSPQVGGADDIRCKTDPTSGDSIAANLLNAMSQEELALMADAAAPFGVSTIATNPTPTVNPINRSNSSSMRLVIPRALSKHLSGRWKNWRVSASGMFSVPSSQLGTRSQNELIHTEHKLIVGHGGIVRQLCPIWKILSAKRCSTASGVRPFEVVTSFRCFCRECPYELKIVRVHGGLVCL